MQFSASEKTDGGGEERDWEKKECKVKDEEGEEEKNGKKNEDVHCILCSEIQT